MSKGIDARMSTIDEDKYKKFDLVVDGVKIDLKRINGLYCEIAKLQLKENEAEKIWIISDDDIHQSYFIKKEALVRICAEFLNPEDLNDIDAIPIANPDRNLDVCYRRGPSAGDKLATFRIDMLNEDEYEVIDMKWLS